MEDPNEEARRLALYDKTRDELLKQQISNSETYDKSLLTLSSTFLGLSLAFIKDIVPLAQVRHLWILFLSWAGLTVVIVSTIWSFIYGQRVIKRLLNGAHRYYKEKDQKAFEESRRYSEQLDRVNELSGFVFIAAVLLSVAFVFVNFQPEASMSKEINTSGETLKKSRPVNQFQEVKPTPAPQQGNQQQSGGQQTGSAQKPKQ